SGPRGITPAFGYSAPHPSARGTSTLLSNALLSAHYRPLRHPRRPGLALTSCRLTATAITAGGFPCCVWFPLSACRRQYPGRTAGLVRSSSPIDLGLPSIRGGSAPASPVSGPAQRSLSLQPANLPSRQKRPSTPEASAASLPPLLLRLLPGGTNSSRAGLSPAVNQRLFTAHAKVRLGRTS